MAIEQGPGWVVLMTVNHLNDYVFNLTLANASGELDTLGVTGWHKFFSEDRQGWVSASELQDGEHLRGHSGTMTVTSIASLPGLHRVYNFTVEQDHVYYVGDLSTLTHNNGCGEELPIGMRDRGPKLGAEQGREFRTDQLETYEFDSSQPSHVRGWLTNERRRVELGQADAPRTPPGFVQAHGRSTPAREGFDYNSSRMQGEDLNILEETTRRKFEASKLGS